MDFNLKDERSVFIVYHVSHLAMAHPIIYSFESSAHYRPRVNMPVLSLIIKEQQLRTDDQKCLIAGEL